MSSTPFDAPLRIEYRPSRWLVAATVFFHAGAVVLLSLTPLDSLPATGLGIMVAASFAVHLRRLLRKNVTLTWRVDGEWVWEEEGARRSLELLGDTFVSASLVVLNLRDPEDGGRRSLVLFPDSLSADTFRRLRVRLGMEREAR